MTRLAAPIAAIALAAGLLLAAGSTRAAEEREILYWYDPMVPQHRFDQPGPSPFMDMDLVPRYADQEAAASGVRIDADTQQNLGLRLARVEKVALAGDLTVPGVVGWDERAVVALESRAAAFVERVTPLAPGDLVQRGQVLAELLVPSWVAAQREYLALRERGDDAQTLADAALTRLRLLGMPEDDVAGLQASGTLVDRHRVRSPLAGAVDAVSVRAGMTLPAGAPLVRLRGLSRVWVEAAVPEALAPRVAAGAPVTITAPGRASPDQGNVAALLPSLDTATRTLRARIELDNADLGWRPGQTVSVTLATGQPATALAIPTEAVIWTGRRTLVMLAQPQGRFVPVAVETGPEHGDLTVIRAGLAEGQRVVASGQFLLDSEASLLGIGVYGEQTP
ncbi:MAG: efflux RND transporter periplasmic adaptor subunit [Pseudomonadales bacterium]